MTPQRFQQIRNVFEAAVEREVGPGAGSWKRPAGAMRTCARRSRACLPPTRGRREVLEPPAANIARMEGRRLGPYEILRELGTGGMGCVYLAVRTDDVYRKPVALKIVRPEAATSEVLKRFRQERESWPHSSILTLRGYWTAGRRRRGCPIL